MTGASVLAAAPLVFPSTLTCVVDGVCRQVVGVYSGRQWALIEEHLADALGRQERDAGDAPAAVQHFMSMLACPQNNLYCQKLYLGQFMETLQQAQQQLVSTAACMHIIMLAPAAGSRSCPVLFSRSTR